MSIFFSGLFDERINSYDVHNGFWHTFFYRGKSEKEAFVILVEQLKKRIVKEFELYDELVKIAENVIYADSS